jgi:hypothetical protein
MRAIRTRRKREDIHMAHAIRHRLAAAAVVTALAVALAGPGLARASFELVRA